MAAVDFRFRGNSRDLEAASQRARTSLRGVDQQAAVTNRELGRLGRTSTDTGNRFGYMAHYFATRAIFGLTTAVAGATVGLGPLGFNFLRVKEQATIAFTTMLHSGARARAFLDDLQAFAAKTPFEFPELVQTTQRMLAMGFAARDVVPSLTAIGDTVADLGGSPEILDRVTVALGQMQLKGRVQSEEMLQLIEAGVNGWGYLAKAMGVNVAKAQDLVTKRTVSGRFAVKAILAGMEQDHADAMEKQSHTFAGLWSTIKDTVSAGAGAALAPLYAALEAGMQRLVTFMGTPEWTAGVRRFSDYVGGTVVPKIIAFGKTVFEFFQTNGATIGHLAGDAARLVATLVRGSARIVGAVGGIRDASGWILGGLFAAKLLGVGSVITRTVVPALATLRGDLIGIRVTAALAGTQMSLMGAAGSRAMFGIRGALISTGIGALMIALGLAAGYVVTHWSQTKEFFEKFWGWMKTGFRVVWATIKELAKAAVYALLQYATAAIRGILEVASHLPFVGKRAREALDGINAYLEKWKPQFSKIAAAAGQSGGDAFGRAYYNAASGWMGQLTTFTGGAGVPGGPTGPVSAGAPPRSYAARVSGPTAAVADLATFLNRRLGVSASPAIDYAGHGKATGLSYHYAGEALDITGSPFALDAAWRFLKTHSAAFAELFYKNEAYHYGVAGKTIPGHGTHIHVAFTGTEDELSKIVTIAQQQTKKKGAAPPPVVPPVVVPPYVPLTSTTDKAKKATGIAAAGAISAAREVVGNLRDRLRVLTREGLGGLVEGVGGRLDAISARIRKGMKTDDLAALKRQLGGVKADIDRAFEIRGLRETATTMLQGLADAFKIETPRTEAQVRELVTRVAAQIRDLRSRLKAGIDPDTLKVLKARLGKLKDAYSEALDEAKRVAAEKMQALNDVVAARRSSFAEAFSTVADKALSVFDAKTAALVAGVRASVQTIEGLVSLGAGEETPAERALREFRASRAASDLARQRAQEDADYAENLAKLQADPETDPAAIAKAQADRLEVVRQRELDDRDAYLEDASATERKAADSAIQAEQARITTERGLVRERFAARLQELQKGWTDEQIANGTAISELTGLLGEYGVDFAAAGGLLGSAFADSFNTALDEVRLAILALIEAINAARANSGLAPVGGAGPVFGDRPFTVRGKVGTYQHGGLLPGPVGVRPDSIMYLGTPGERLLSQEQQQWLERAGGGGPQITLVNPQFFGATPREVGRSLEKIVSPAAARVVSYPAPL